MFHAHLVSQGVAPGRDVADRPHVRCAGAAVVVAHHAVVDLDAAAVQPVGGRVRADADDDEVGVEFGAVAEHHLLDPVGSADLGHPDAAAHVDALGAVQPRHQLADLLAEHRRQRRRLRFHQHDVDAHAAQAGRHLAADEPGADDDRAPRGAGLLAQRQALVERPQHVDALEIRERRNALGHQAGRDDQLVVGELDCRRPASASARRCPPTGRRCRAAR